MKKDRFVVEFNQVNRQDLDLVGGKGANLGELTQAGFPVPPGFIITAEAYWELLQVNGLVEKIRPILSRVKVKDIRSLNQASKQIKQLIAQARVPEPIVQSLIRSYLKLGAGFNQALVAVRSSATAEDLPDASFAGQQETFLNVRGEANLIQKVRACWASLFEPRAIFYRLEKGFDHFQVGIALPVQKMIQSQVSGIMFTINPVTNDKNQIVIEAIYGLGEKIVQGAYTPDHYLVQKLTWKILQKQHSPQLKELVFGDRTNRERRLPRSKQKRAKLNEKQIVSLAKLGHRIQQHYFFPQDIEWAWSKNQFYLIQSRPVTTINLGLKKNTELKSAGLKLLLKGEPASPGFVSGRVRVLKSAREINQLLPREILVTEMTTPDFVPAMKQAAAIITDTGGQTSHAAIVSRELGIPCIVGSKSATKDLKTGTLVALDGASGKIYRAKRISKAEVKPVLKKPTAKQLEPDTLPTATKVYVNLGEPDLAGTIAQKNVDGVGLLRAEFMIAQIGTHPKKLIADQRQNQFISSLADGLLKFCQAFYPRPVVYRTTDFKTNEYANLRGGQAYEPEEANPMIGYRGAFRYLADAAVFKLELAAIKIVRDKHRFNNLWLMLPFVRTVPELVQVKKIVSDSGLVRSGSFKLWLMVEIPSNVILLEEFIKVGIDGVSIGTNDLTMLILGVDRDNSEVAPLYDERNPAVLWALEKTIKTCQKQKITCSICGQAPSQYPDLTEKLVRWGITSVSVSPDAIESSREIIYQAEARVLHG